MSTFPAPDTRGQDQRSSNMNITCSAWHHNYAVDNGRETAGNMELEASVQESAQLQDM